MYLYSKSLEDSRLYRLWKDFASDSGGFFRRSSLSQCLGRRLFQTRLSFYLSSKEKAICQGVIYILSQALQGELLEIVFVALLYKRLMRFFLQADLSRSSRSFKEQGVIMNLALSHSICSICTASLVQTPVEKQGFSSIISFIPRASYLLRIEMSNVLVMLAQPFYCVISNVFRRVISPSIITIRQSGILPYWKNTWPFWNLFLVEFQSMLSIFLAGIVLNIWTFLSISIIRSLSLKGKIPSNTLNSVDRLSQITTVCSAATAQTIIVPLPSMNTLSPKYSPQQTFLQRFNYQTFLFLMPKSRCYIPESSQAQRQAEPVIMKLNLRVSSGILYIIWSCSQVATTRLDETYLSAEGPFLLAIFSKIGYLSNSFSRRTSCFSLRLFVCLIIPNNRTRFFFSSSSSRDISQQLQLGNRLIQSLMFMQSLLVVDQQGFDY